MQIFGSISGFKLFLYEMGFRYASIYFYSSPEIETIEMKFYGISEYVNKNHEN